MAELYLQRKGQREALRERSALPLDFDVGVPAAPEIGIAVGGVEEVNTVRSLWIPAVNSH